MTSSATQSQVSKPVLGTEIGAQIGAVFGVVFVWVNSAGLPVGVRIALLAVASGALVTIVVLSVRSRRAHAVQRADTADAPRSSAVSTGERPGSPFGWKYWLVVTVEVLALIVGSQLLSRLGYPELGIAWVAVVVGTHFFALAPIFRLARFHVLAVLVTACGLTGFALRAFGMIEAIPIISGVLTGFVLITFALWALVSRRAHPRKKPVPGPRGRSRK